MVFIYFRVSICDTLGARACLVQDFRIYVKFLSIYHMKDRVYRDSKTKWQISNNDMIYVKAKGILGPMAFISHISQTILEDLDGL